MADYISLTTLAKTLNTNFNTIATTLFASNDIDRAIPFNIVEDVQDWEGEDTFSSTVLVPGIMYSLTSSVAPSQTYQSYSNTVLVTVYAFKRELEDTKKVIEEYINANTGKFNKLSGWIYQQELELPTVIFREVNNTEERVSLVFNITYNFIYNGYISDDVTIKFNGEEVPVLSYVHDLQVTSTSTPDLTTPGITKHKPKTGNITKTISFVFINNTEINKIHRDIDTGDYLINPYTVFYGIDYDVDLTTYAYDNTEIMSITSGKIEFIEGGFITINVTLGIYKDLS